MPTNATQGNFGTDGMFGIGNVAEKQESRPITKNQWAVLEADDDITPSPPKNTQDFGSHFAPTKDRVIRDTIGHNVIASPLRDPMLGFGIIPKPEPFNTPVFTFNPPQWFYQDPSHRTQGPFTSEQMNGWYTDGYFPVNLPIRCAGDREFIPLLKFVEKYGDENPFLDSLVEQESIEREIFMQSVQQRPQGMRNSPQIGMGLAPLPIVSAPIYHDFSHAMLDPGLRTPFQQPQPARFTPPMAQQFVAPARSEKQALLQFMQHQQFVDPQSVISGLPKNQTVQEVTRPVSPVRKPDIPSPESENEEVQDVADEPKASTGKSKKKKASDERKLSPAPVKKAVKSKVSPKPDPAEPTAEEVIVESKPEPKPSPWAQVKKPSEPELKKIQETEQKRKNEIAAKEKKWAEERIIAEASHLAQKEAASNSSLVSGAQWAATEKPPKAKSTLAEIMAEEAQRKQKELSQAPPAAAKGYANAAISGISKVPNFSKVVKATNTIVKPMADMAIETKQDDGWNVVGKKSPITTVPVSTPVPTQRAAPVRINYAQSPVSSPQNSDGQAPKSIGSKTNGVSTQFRQWCRNTLKIVRDSSLNRNHIFNQWTNLSTSCYLLNSKKLLQ